MRRWAYIAAFLVGSATARTAGANPSAGEDAAGRRAIRGHAVELTHESEALQQLRALDEESFPRHLGDLPSPGSATPDEGRAPDAPAPLASAESPPAALRSPALLDDRSDVPATPTAVPWLAGLALPDLPVRFDAHVVRYLDLYRNDARGRSIMTSWLRAQGRYRTLIEDHLRRAHLPQALLYVAMIESGYDPDDRSSAGAVGLWQFMPEGARIYGLRIDHWVDERRDPERATAAVMHYFEDLHARFGSWHMALAAFNSGYGAVLRAIAKYNTNDYWELCRWEDGLPWETTLYVPKALAAAIVGENRARFGYESVVADPPFDFERVGVKSSMSFASIAKAAGVPVEQVVRLNPELRRGRTPPEPWDLRLPRGSGARFSSSSERYAEHLATRALRFGERLDDIAHAVGVQTRELRRINGISDTSECKPGLVLLVPVGRAPLAEAGDAEPVIVAVPDRDATVAGRKRVFYRSLPGDQLADVAAYFHVSSGDVARWNRLDADARFTSQQVLQLWVAPDFDTARAALLDPARVRLVTVGTSEFFDLVEARRGRKRLAVKVKAGDTLDKLARRYHLTVPDLERINRFGRKTELTVGQTLTVYVAMTAAEKAAHERQWRLAPSVAATPALLQPPLVAPPEASPVVDASRPALAPDADDSDDALDDEATPAVHQQRAAPAAGGVDDPGL